MFPAPHPSLPDVSPWGAFPTIKSNPVLQLRVSSACLSSSISVSYLFFGALRCLPLMPHTRTLSHTQALRGNSAIRPEEYIYMYTYVSINIYIHTYMHTYIHTYIHTYVYTYIHMYICTYIHTYIHTFIHTYIHTYVNK